METMETVIDNALNKDLLESEKVVKEAGILKTEENTLVLPISQVKVKMNFDGLNGHTLIKIRKEADSEELIGTFLIAEISTFNGEKKTAFDILDMDMDDVLALESFYVKKKAQRNLMHKKL